VVPTATARPTRHTNPIQNHMFGRLQRCCCLLTGFAARLPFFRSCLYVTLFAEPRASQRARGRRANSEREQSRWRSQACVAAQPRRRPAGAFCLPRTQVERRYRQAHGGEATVCGEVPPAAGARTRAGAVFAESLPLVVRWFSGENIG